MPRMFWLNYRRSAGAMILGALAVQLLPLSGSLERGLAAFVGSVVAGIVEVSCSTIWAKKRGLL